MITSSNLYLFTWICYAVTSIMLLLFDISVNLTSITLNSHPMKLKDGEIVYADWMPQKDQDTGKIQSNVIHFWSHRQLLNSSDCKVSKLWYSSFFETNFQSYVFNVFS